MKQIDEKKTKLSLQFPKNCSHTSNLSCFLNCANFLSLPFCVLGFLVVFSGSTLLFQTEAEAQTSETVPVRATSAENRENGSYKEYSSTMIWDEAKHNAFTDILKFQDKYYCTFRESSVGHIPGKVTGEGDGTVRVLRSADGEHWESVALLRRSGFDLRDSKLSVMPEGRLMVIMGGSIYQEQKLMGRCTQVAFSDENGENFSDPKDVEIDPTVRSEVDWLWRVTWHNGIGYGVLYQPLDSDWTLRLLKTTDGIHYQHITQLAVTGRPNETTVRFAPDGRMLLLVRREEGREKGTNTAWLGSAQAPFQDWNWEPIGVPLGGPNFLFLPNGTMLLGGRVDGKMELGTLDTDGHFKRFTVLPSGGDCSYPGFLIVDDELWVSYYAWAKIYLAKIPLADIPEQK